MKFIFLVGVMFFMSSANSNNFSNFLDEFMPQVEAKSRQTALLQWIAETTGSKDSTALLSELSYEFQLLFHDKEKYINLLNWQKTLSDPILKRQAEILIKSFKANQISKELTKKIIDKETTLMQIYSNFRPKLGDKIFTENDIIDALKKETNVERRKEIWELSKQIGETLAPYIIEVVKLRNLAAKELGYSDYFQMQLDLQDIDKKWLLSTFEKLFQKSKEAYLKMFDSIEGELARKFKVTKENLGPWAWNDPFGQEDPLAVTSFDQLFMGKDIISFAKAFYKEMEFDVEPILKRSDLYEREGKNQHAFCINIDRKEDVRTLYNIKPTIRWMETLLHELGHAMYDLGYNQNLPWLLKDSPHLLTTEAMALFAGRQAYSKNFLKTFVKANDDIIDKIEQSQKRRELIFSRWVLVMTNFESELYKNPDQDLNLLWWKLVEKYQGIKAPKNRENKQDWAAKYHIGLAPVYYHSYLLGEMFASFLKEKSHGKCDKNCGEFLKKELFYPGSSLKWNELIEKIIGKPLSADAWLKEYAF